MHFREVIAASIPVGLAAAAGNVAPTLPFDSQVGSFNLPLACTLNGKALTINALISATAPVIVNPGQKVFLQDATAKITVPASAIPSGVSSVNVLSSAALGLSNASPATVQVFPGGSQWNNGTKVTSGKPVTISYPKNGGVLGAIGPITAGSDGVSKVFLGALSAKVYTYNAQGALTSNTPLTVSCPASKPALFLANLNIQGSKNATTNAPANGVPFNAPTIPVGSEYGFFHTYYSCSLLGFTIPVDLKFGGLSYSSYKKGSQFYLGNITSFLNIGQNWINAAHALYDAESFETTVTNVQVNVTNATPTYVNAIKTPVTVTSPYQTAGGLNITFPTTGFLQAGPFIASGAQGSYLSYYISTSIAQLVIRDGNGKVTNNGSVVCHPQGVLDLYSVLIN